MFDNYDEFDIIRDEKKYLVLIIYDIIEDKQRRKFIEYIEQFACRVQKSAFEAMLTKSKYNKLLKGIEKVISTKDNIRIYKIDGKRNVVSWGKEKELFNDEDIMIL